jgi:Na+/serine symporter
VLVAGLLAVTGFGKGWGRAADLAVVVGALAVAVLAVPVLVAAWQLRAVAARPEPPQAAGCAGCACSGGGCGVLG